MRKTKIVCTIGPASSDEAMLRRMVENGMNVARLNFSHGSYDNFHTLIEKIKKIRKEMEVPLAILLDTKGPEIRLGTFKDHKPVELKEGQKFTLTSKTVEGDDTIATVQVPTLWKSLRPGNRVLIDDGLVELTVDEIVGEDIVTTVRVGGPVSDHKGVNVPYVKVEMPFLSEKDKEDLRFGIREDVDFVAASFVRCAEDVQDLRRFLNDNDGEFIRIISKIENAEGVENFDSILALSDGIMVARGDMGVEIEFERIPGLQKTFIRKTCEAGKMSITATQMLESMIENSTPTRAEITDVANAVFDGTSAIMLSGETAMGAHPALVVKTMADIALQAEKDAGEIIGYSNWPACISREDPLFAICDAAVTLAKDMKAKVIVAESTTGRTSRGVSSFRPVQPIIAPTPALKTYHQLSLSWGVVPMLVYIQSNTDGLFEIAVDCAKKSGLAGPGDVAVLTAGIPVGKAPTTNLLKVEVIE